MTARHCHDCGRQIPTGLAVMRSRAFQLVTMCRECGPGTVERRRPSSPPATSVA